MKNAVLNNFSFTNKQAQDLAEAIVLDGKTFLREKKFSLKKRGRPRSAVTTALDRAGKNKLTNWIPGNFR